MTTLEDRLDLLEQKLRDKLEVMTGFADESVKAKKCEELFKYFDENRTGEIDIEEFFTAMTQLNFVGVQGEIEGLFNRYDEDCSGTLNFREFSQKLFGLIPSHTLDHNSRDVIERIRTAISTRAGGSGVHALTCALHSMDQDNSKTLDQDELVAGLKQLGCEINEDKDLRIVMRHFDKEGSGRISIDEFIRAIKAGMTYERKLLVKEAFSRLDRTGDGVVALDDIMHLYKFDQHPAVQGGFMPEEEAARQFLEIFEAGSEHEAGVVTWTEFLDCYRGLSVAIDDDDYFELMMRNSWRIPGDEGEAANTANRRVLVTHSDGSEEVVEVINNIGCGNSMIEIKQRLEEQGVEDIYKLQL